MLLLIVIVVLLLYRHRWYGYSPYWTYPHYRGYGPYVQARCGYPGYYIGGYVWNGYRWQPSYYPYGFYYNNPYGYHRGPYWW